MKKFKVGDCVRITKNIEIAKLDNVSSYDNINYNKFIGKVAKIIKIWKTGKYPYDLNIDVRAEEKEIEKITKKQYEIEKVVDEL
jgi:hypothetical protein